MYPPADDNYGVDACSVLVLQTSPPLLVVGTCAGTLYHCLLLSPEDEGEEGTLTLRDLSAVDDEDAVRKDTSKVTGFYKYLVLLSFLFAACVSVTFTELLLFDQVWNTSKNNSLAGQPVLHAFESIELELGLSLDDDLLEDASFNCPLHLQKHPTANDRYFLYVFVLIMFCVSVSSFQLNLNHFHFFRYLVSHEAGIHILFLPIVGQLNKFVEASDGRFLCHCFHLHNCFFFSNKFFVLFFCL